MRAYILAATLALGAGAASAKPKKLPRMVVDQGGQRAFVLDPMTGDIFLATGKLLGRYDFKSGDIVSAASRKVVGRVKPDGTILERGQVRGQLDKLGVIMNGPIAAGSIDDSGAVMRAGTAWAVVSECCKDPKQKRLVVAFLAFFTSDFIPSLAMMPQAERDAPEEGDGIQISHENGIRWAYVYTDGTITAEDGTRLGTVADDGEVTLDNGIRVGAIDKGGQIVRANGVRVGSLNKSGQLARDNGTRVAQIRQDGLIVMESGVRWGTATACCKEAVARQRVAVALVFFAPDFWGESLLPQ